MKRLEMGRIFPEAYKLMRQIDDEIKKAGLNPLWLELIKIRTSQINGCAYCLNKHISDAIKLGEKPERIYVLSAWHEAKNWFSEEEQTILTMTEEVAHISQHGVSDEVYDRAVNLFGEEKTAGLLMAMVSINSWNRVGVAQHLHPVSA